MEPHWPHPDGIRFLLERVSLFLHGLRQDPSHAGRDLSFWIGIAFIALALLVIGFSIVQFRRVFASVKPAEIPERYRSWSDITMNLAVVLLGKYARKNGAEAARGAWKPRWSRATQRQSRPPDVRARPTMSR